ncbi:hypothetical protein AAG906_006702 [Vitis piasezkii]
MSTYQVKGMTKPESCSPLNKVNQMYFVARYNSIFGSQEPAPLKIAFKNMSELELLQPKQNQVLANLQKEMKPKDQGARAMKSSFVTLAATAEKHQKEEASFWQMALLIVGP